MENDIQKPMSNFKCGETVESIKYGCKYIIIANDFELFNFLKRRILYADTDYLIYNLDTKDVNIVSEFHVKSYCTNIERSKSILRNVKELLYMKLYIKKEDTNRFDDEFLK